VSASPGSSPARVPWIPTINRPAEEAAIYHINIDPLKPGTPLWYIGATQCFQADALTALRQLNAHLEGESAPDPAAVAARRQRYAERQRKRAQELSIRERLDAGVITPAYLTACLRRRLGEDWIILNEGITNYGTVCDHMARSCPGSMLASGGGSLGWSGGAAIGVKLAKPDAQVAVLTGDGSYMFSQPSTVHWMARRYDTPFLQVIYNNRGWKAPKLSTLAIHPDGTASRAADIGVAFDPPPDYAEIAIAAGNAFGRILKDPAEVEDGIAEALEVLNRDRRSAVLDCWLAPL
jgi:acetolactate synthase-1/2/3 large subunit